MPDRIHLEKRPLRPLEPRLDPGELVIRPPMSHSPAFQIHQDLFGFSLVFLVLGSPEFLER